MKDLSVRNWAEEFWLNEQTKRAGLGQVGWGGKNTLIAPDNSSTLKGILI